MAVSEEVLNSFFVRATALRVALKKEKRESLYLLLVPHLEALALPG